MARIVPRREVEKELANRGCIKLKEYAFRSGSLWQTRDGSFSFVVPQEIGGWTGDDDLRRVLEMLDSRLGGA
ncbi:MAG TPA: hypothetical protein VG889_16260 [Rhizomicrobium sp.]|nr:hypothetical protein [Rhizomicrobium sp.]